jgi:Domain of unknown function (DUF4926)
MSKKKIKLLDTVALIEDLPERKLKRGEVGTVVEILAPEVFEVEFSDGEGQTYAELALRADQVIALQSGREVEDRCLSADQRKSRSGGCALSPSRSISLATSFDPLRNRRARKRFSEGLMTARVFPYESRVPTQILQKPICFQSLAGDQSRKIKRTLGWLLQ